MLFCDLHKNNKLMRKDYEIRKLSDNACDTIKFYLEIQI